MRWKVVDGWVVPARPWGWIVYWIMPTRALRRRHRYNAAVELFDQDTYA
jgi:hypothetical protein